MKNVETAGSTIPDPKIALMLATIAYDDPGAIPLQVYGQTHGHYEVAWGPVVDDSILAGQYSCMYVAKNRVDDEYFVVIRGTNPYSLYSWLYEDFNVERVRLFSELSGVPSNPQTNAPIS